MRRSFSMLLLGAVSGAALALLAGQSNTLFAKTCTPNVTSEREVYKALALFGDVFEHVRRNYVEKPDDMKLIQYALTGMLSGLDPHSGYMDSKGFSDLEVETRGQFGGLGIEVTSEDGL